MTCAPPHQTEREKECAFICLGLLASAWICMGLLRREWICKDLSGSAQICLDLPRSGRACESASMPACPRGAEKHAHAVHRQFTCISCTVAILAQGTHWAVAVTQAYSFSPGTRRHSVCARTWRSSSQGSSTMCPDAGLKTCMPSDFLAYITLWHVGAKGTRGGAQG